MKIHKDILKEKLWKSDQLIEETIVDTSRWSIFKEMIFRHEGRVFRCEYSEGATENQFEAPFENSSEFVECTEVEKRYVVTPKWVDKGPKLKDPVNVYKVNACGFGSYIDENWNNVLDTLDESDGFPMFVDLIEMEREEYEALPEFDGF